MHLQFRHIEPSHKKTGSFAALLILFQ